MSVFAARPRPVELSADGAFNRRIVRLGVVSAIVLGMIAIVAERQSAPAMIVALLLVGWGTMPTLLFLSLWRPLLRIGLLIPSTTVTLGVLWLAASPPAASPSAGWPLIAIGILLGDLLGIWFWFRLLPVPAALDRPFSPGRWAMVAVHVACVVVGLAVLIR